MIGKSVNREIMCDISCGICRKMFYNRSKTVIIILCKYQIKTGGKDMPDYKQMYFMLFNSITDALTLMQRGEQERAAELLRQAQQLGEEMYIDG